MKSQNHSVRVTIGWHGAYLRVHAAIQTYDRAIAVRTYMTKDASLRVLHDGIYYRYMMRLHVHCNSGIFGL